MEEIDFQTDPLAIIVDDYLRRLRAGEDLAIEEYAAKHPEMADRVRQMLGMVRGLEQLRSKSIAETGLEAASFSTFAGRRLGDFVLVREIGRGGMGVVYEAIQESLGRRVALKLFLSSPKSDANHLERFEREARAAAQLHHTNIVPVFAVGREAGLVFYAMQYLSGHSLDCVIASLRDAGLPHGMPGIRGVPPAPQSAGPPIDGTSIEGLHPLASDTPRPADDTVPHASVERLRGEEVTARAAASRLRGTRTQHNAEQTYFRNVARLGMHAAEALAYAHQQGVLHRDIKPSNLFLDTAGTIWLTDFGLAKAQGNHDLTATGDILGTLRYMPPERLKGESLPQGDVYSLGITLHELLTLRPAFDVPDRAQLIDKLLREPVSPPGRFVPAIPRDLDTIITKATAHDPRDRYLTAAAFAADLRHFLQDEPISARRLGQFEKFERWVRRNPILTGLAAAILLLSLSLALGSTYAALRIATARDQAISARSLESDARELAEQKSADEQRQRQRAEEHLTRALGAETQATAAALRSQREAQVAQRVAGYLLELFADPDPYHWRPIADEASAQGERLARPELIAQLDRQMQQHFVELRDKPDELVSRLQAAALGNGFLIPNFPTRRILEQALTIGQRTQGLEHPSTTWTIFWLGKAFDLEGRPEFAEPFLRKCVETWQRGGDPALQPADLGNGALGTVLLKKGRLAEAEFSLREAVALCRQKNDLVSLAAWLTALASVLERQGKLIAAEQCQVESVQLLSGLHGATDHRTLEAQVKLAEILRLQQDLAAAEEILHDSLAAWLEPRNRQQTGRVDALIELSRVLAGQGRQDEAEQCAREAVEAANGMSAGYRGLRERANDALLDSLISRDSAAEVDLLAAKIVEAQWRNAAEAHREALRLFQHAESCAAAGDQAGYATTCRQIIERFQDSESAEIAFTVARACYLAPSGLDKYDAVLQLVNWGIAIQPDNRHLQVARGAILYRAGEFAKAAEFLLPVAESGVRTHKGTSLERFFLAAALAKLGDSAAATRWFKSGAEWLASKATPAAGTAGASLRQPENSGPQTPEGEDPWRELRSLHREVGTLVMP